MNDSECEAMIAQHRREPPVKGLITRDGGQLHLEYKVHNYRHLNKWDNGLIAVALRAEGIDEARIRVAIDATGPVAGPMSRAGGGTSNPG